MKVTIQGFNFKYQPLQVIEYEEKDLHIFLLEAEGYPQKLYRVEESKNCHFQVQQQVLVIDDYFRSFIYGYPVSKKV